MPTHWQEWHLAYDDPTSSLSRRLGIVQRQLASTLDELAAGPVRLLSLCAGDGRDVLGVLEAHRRADDVDAVLVELDEGLLGRARDRARAMGHSKVATVGSDAGSTSLYADDGPFDVVLCCGVFGNVTDADVRRTIFGLAALVEAGGSAIWTRHRRPPDLTESIRAWFEEAGFEERAFVPVEGSLAAVGRHVRTTAVPPVSTPDRLFNFVGDGLGALA